MALVANSNMHYCMKEFTRNCWSKMYYRMKGAVVFINDPCAECLHWEGGLFMLIKAGADCVKSLTPTERGRKDQDKAVFITQATSKDIQIVEQIVKNSHFHKCILISATSFNAVYMEMNDGLDVYDIVSSGDAAKEAERKLRSMLVELINKQQHFVDVEYIPIFAIAATSNVFVTPPYHTLYPMFNGKLIPSSPHIDLNSFNHCERSKIRRLASNLHGMLEMLGVESEVYSIGAYSSVIAKLVNCHPRTLTQKKCQTASLVLVDRTLDLCGVTSHSLDSIVDKILAVLPKFPQHSTDVAVDMSSLCDANVFLPGEYMQLCPGSLYQGDDDSCKEFFEHMVLKPEKQVISDLYKKLSKIDVLKSPATSKIVKVTQQSLEKIVTATKGNYDLIQANVGLLQQALAVLQTLKSPKYSQIELMTSLTNQVLQNIAISGESTSVLNQVSQIIKSRKERNISLQHILALLIYIYSVAGVEVTFSKQHEGYLTEMLGVAIFEDCETILPYLRADGKAVTAEECAEIAIHIVNQLRDVGKMRKDFKEYKSVIKPRDAGLRHEYYGLLQQLAEDMIDRTELKFLDVKHKDDSFSDGHLTTGPKRDVALRHLSQSTLLVVFVVGGITVEESNRIKAVFDKDEDVTFMLGSTKLVTPVDAMRNVFML